LSDSAFRRPEYLPAYAAYQHWDISTFDRFLQKGKDVVLVPAPSESDEADKSATEYFRQHADGNEDFLVYNGELRDVSLNSTRDTVRHDPEKLKAVIKAGSRWSFSTNHLPEDGRPAMYPGFNDFGVAGLFSFIANAENPSLAVELRVVQPGKESTIVSYGFKGTAVEDIKNIALEYRNAVASQADLAPVELRQELLDYHTT
jgi:hypothetical protein